MASIKKKITSQGGD